MKLPKMRLLMGLLARDMQRRQVKELLAALPTSCVSQTDKENCKTAISFFVLLKKRTGTNEAFLGKLEHLLTQCKCNDFLITIEKFKSDHPDLLVDSSWQLNLPNGTRTGFRPRQGQSDRFRSVLLNISRSVPKKQLEIMVALSPTPEAGKQGISEGHELFDQMERHGCISENDTEMLQEMLELFSLTDAIKFLTQYQTEFPPVLHDPEPNAPVYAPSSSLSMQASGFVSLPAHQYQGQPQSFHHLSHQSLPINASGYSSPPASFSRQPLSSFGPSVRQGDSLSAPLSGGSSSYMYASNHPSSESHSAPVSAQGHTPLSTSHMESGEGDAHQNTRQFVAGESPTFQRRALGGPVKPFTNNELVSSTARRVSSSAGGGSDIYPRPRLGKRRSQGEEGGFNEGGRSPLSLPSSAASSGIYPRPLHERGKEYPYPTSKLLSEREKARAHAAAQAGSEVNISMPPPAKLPRSPDYHSGDGATFSRLRRQGNSQLPDQSEGSTLSTLSTYSGDSEKFNSGEAGGADVNILQAGQGDPYSHGTLESYRAEHSSASEHSANLEQPHDPVHPHPSTSHFALAQPRLNSASNSIFSYSAESLNLPEGQQDQPLLSSGPPSNVSSLPSYRQDAAELPRQNHSSSQESSHEAQFRNAPRGGGYVQLALHHNDPGYQYHQQQGGGDQHPFVGQGGLSAPVGHSHAPSMQMGTPPSSSLSNYPGPSSASFPASGVEERGDSHMPGGRHGQKSSPAYREPAILAKKSAVLSKTEAMKVQKAVPFQSINQSATGSEKVDHSTMEQLSDVKKHHSTANSHPHKTEQGRKIAQASSDRNVDLHCGAANEDKEQQSSSKENESFQMASNLYPRLPLVTTTEQSSSTHKAVAGTKRARTSSQQVEPPQEGREEEERETKKEEEEEQSVAKKQKTSQRVTRSAAKKTGLFSQVKKFFGRFSSNKAVAESESTSEEQSLERNEDTESDSEFFDAQEN